MTIILWDYLVGFAVAFASSLALTPVFRDWAWSVGLVDSSDGARKLHTYPVPRIGGIAIAFAAAIAGGTLVLIEGPAALYENSALFAAVAGGFAIHLLGLWDDFAPIRARYKLVWQLFIASTVFAAGLRIETIALPIVGELTFSPWASYLCTILWLVGVTNAFNLIDGLDGLASGIALIALAVMSLIAVSLGNTAVALASILIASATLGFLRYNFAPASIFLGDSGSLFLGFMLAGLSVLAFQTPSGVFPMTTPLLILGIPCLDTTLAVVRRMLRGQKIFHPDRGHIHHRLLILSDGPCQAVLRLYAVATGLALAAVVVTYDPSIRSMILVMAFIASLLAIYWLRFPEFQSVASVAPSSHNPGYPPSHNRGM